MRGMTLVRCGGCRQRRGTCHGCERDCEATGSHACPSLENELNEANSERRPALPPCTPGVWAASSQGVRKLYGLGSAVRGRRAPRQFRRKMATGRPAQTPDRRHAERADPLRQGLWSADAQAREGERGTCVRDCPRHRRVRVRAAPRGRLRAGLGCLLGLGPRGVGELLAIAIVNLATFGPPWMAALPGLSFMHSLVLSQASTAAASVLPGGDAVGIAISYSMLRRWGFTVEQVTVGSRRDDGLERVRQRHLRGRGRRAPGGRRRVPRAAHDARADRRRRRRRRASRCSRSRSTTTATRGCSAASPSGSGTASRASCGARPRAAGTSASSASGGRPSACSRRAGCALTARDARRAPDRLPACCSSRCARSGVTSAEVSVAEAFAAWALIRILTTIPHHPRRPRRRRARPHGRARHVRRAPRRRSSRRCCSTACSPTCRRSRSGGSACSSGGGWASSTSRRRAVAPEKRMKGLEPSTFAMARRRSSQLSYIRRSVPA